MAYHVKYRIGARGDIARDVVTEKYILGMRILMLGYEHALRTIKELKGDQLNGIAASYESRVIGSDLLPRFFCLVGFLFARGIIGDATHHHTIHVPGHSPPPWPVYEIIPIVLNGFEKTCRLHLYDGELTIDVH